MWEKDRLDRKKYADFLYTLISNSDKYKRAEGEDAYVIALDSPWGTGKTYFLNLFEQWVSEEKKMQVIHYSAWENDFWDNAFLPLLYAICYHPVNKEDAVDLDNAKYVKDIFHLTLRLGREAGLKQMERVIGEGGVEALRNAMDHVEDEKATSVSAVFQEYKDFKEAYETVKEMLQKNIPKGQKLLIVVDELDRCRPDFAVQTLEVVKHLFNVDGLVFLFSVDMEQLGCVIRGIYGESLDARNYLNRLFQYVTHLPEPNVRKYIELLFDEKKENFEEVHQTDDHKKLLVEVLAELVNGFQLSLRELDTIWKNYLVLYDYKLKEYVLTEAHLCYLLFLILKYKYSNLEQKMSTDEALSLSELGGLYNCTEMMKKDSIFKDLLETAARMPLKEIDGTLRNTLNPRIEETKARIITVKEGRIRYSYGEEQCDYTCVRDITSFSGILFAPDLASWEQIKDQTIIRYMKNQLELITFDGEIV